MNRLQRLSVLIICLLSSCTAPTSNQDFFHHLPKPKGWVNDYEDIYTEAEEHRLDSMISHYNKTANIQFCIVTLDTSNVQRSMFDALILKIANEWGVGDKHQNNGMVIGISKGYRYMRIQNGPGIEAKISNEQTSTFIREDFIPAFKRENYYEGTVQGLSNIATYLSTQTAH